MDDPTLQTEEPEVLTNSLKPTISEVMTTVSVHTYSKVTNNTSSKF